MDIVSSSRRECRKIGMVVVVVVVVVVVGDFILAVVAMAAATAPMGNSPRHVPNTGGFRSFGIIGGLAKPTQWI